MPGYQGRGEREHSQERYDDRREDPDEAYRRSSQRSFTQSLRLGRAQQGSDEIVIDPFLEYVRADGQGDDDQCEDRPIGDRQAQNCALR